MLPQLVNMLTWWEWVILAAIPAAIVALHFLKLKRRPLEVPSTWLWHKSTEDLHVNALWQRLRRNSLLWLQLLLVGLVMLAVLRPGWQGARLAGNRFILLLDNSASMQATDVAPTRLEEAKRRAGELIDSMSSGDVAMIVSFADAARIEQSFTDDRAQLRRSLTAIRPTQRSTSLDEALKVASGLNSKEPAKLLIFSDGKFDDPSGCALGSLEPVFVPIATPDARNIGIVSFTARRHPVRPNELQALARFENFGPDASIGLELFLDGRLVGADELRIGAAQGRSVTFDLKSASRGALHLKAATGDHLALDDEAWLAIRPPRPTKVLLITPGNQPLQLALQTASVSAAVQLRVEPPAFLDQEDYNRQEARGAYDLVIYDRCRPKKMPQANTLTLGALPPLSGWSAKPQVKTPQIIDVDSTHPLMQWIDLGNVTVAEAAPLVLPPGCHVLIDCVAGPLMAIAPRDGFEDAVLALSLIDQTPDAGAIGRFRSDWPFRSSFPAFVMNLVEYFGHQREALLGAGVRPGQSITLHSPGAEHPLSVRTSQAKLVELHPDQQGECSFTATEEVGLYQVISADAAGEQFAINLFDSKESDIRPKSDQRIKIGCLEISGKPGWQPARREAWKLLLGVALVVLLLEWYTYTNRVFG